MLSPAAPYTRRRTNAQNLAVFAAMRLTDERMAEAKRRGMILCWRCRAESPVGTKECPACRAWIADMGGNKIGAVLLTATEKEAMESLEEAIIGTTTATDEPVVRELVYEADEENPAGLAEAESNRQHDIALSEGTRRGGFCLAHGSDCDGVDTEAY